jgi:hypothetical protein
MLITIITTLMGICSSIPIVIPFLNELLCGGRYLSVGKGVADVTDAVVVW